MADIKRYAPAPDDKGRSAILETEPANTQTKGGVFRRSTLWATRELPVDITVDGDRSLAEGLGPGTSPTRTACRPAAATARRGRHAGTHPSAATDCSHECGRVVRTASMKPGLLPRAVRGACR